MRCSVLYRVILLLEIILNITSKAIHKKLKVAKVFLKELFKFQLDNKTD